MQQNGMVNRIRQLRKSRKMTMQQLADALGTSAATINRLEKGQRNLTLVWMNRIAKVLNVEPNELMPEGSNAVSGLRENAELYTPDAGGPLQPVNHYIYVRILTDDLSEHPDGVPEGALLCFDLNDTEQIASGKIVLVSAPDGFIVASYAPPNKIHSNRSDRNWIVNLDDSDLPYEPEIRGSMRFVIRKSQS